MPARSKAVNFLFSVSSRTWSINQRYFTKINKCDFEFFSLAKHSGLNRKVTDY